MKKDEKVRVRLRPMTTDEYAKWLPHQTSGYAEAKVRAGNWAATNALELAQQQMRELLPNGIRTQGHSFFAVVDGVKNEVVGTLWIHVRESPQGLSAYIYDIEMYEIHRGKGYGTATFAALEQLMRQDGVQCLMLHVFGFNTEAKRLYERLGFEITNVNMAKML